MKKRFIISLIAVCMMVLWGCKADSDTSTEVSTVSEDNSVYLYYPSGDSIEKNGTPYQLKQPDSIIPSVEEVMTASLENYDGKLESYTYMVDDDNNVTIQIIMAEEPTREYCLLTMAAVSDTLFQMDMVQSVKLTLVNADGEALDSKLMLRNTIYHYDSASNNVEKQLKFYKAAKGGQGLEGLSGTLVLDDNVSLAENVVNKLEEINAIPEDTKVNSLHIISGVCYLDLSEEFLGDVADTKSDQVVYSVVNSLTSLTSIEKVKITVEGEEIESYRGTVDLRKPLSFNSEIIK